VRSLEAGSASSRQQHLLDASSPATRRGSEYAELSRQVRRAGLLDRRPWYYARKITVTTVLFAAGWAAFALVGDSWWQLAVAVFLAVMFTQVGFLGHDAGHRQILGSRKASYIIGILHGNLGIGLSYGWWVGKHNRHHAHPNQQGTDPDIMLSVLAFTEPQAHAGRGLSRPAFRFQAYLFFPMLLLEAFTLHVASLRALTGRAPRYRAWETGLYLGSSFAPNHKGMPILDASDRTGFLDRQVLTSRNVRGGRLTDLALGGLNYQIEHHLFPTPPRANLKRAQAIIQPFCEAHGLSYEVLNPLKAYWRVYLELRRVGSAAIEI